MVKNNRLRVGKTPIWYPISSKKEKEALIVMKINNKTMFHFKKDIFCSPLMFSTIEKIPNKELPKKRYEYIRANYKDNFKIEQDPTSFDQNMLFAN